MPPQNERCTILADQRAEDERVSPWNVWCSILIQSFTALRSNYKLFISGSTICFVCLCSGVNGVLFAPVGLGLIAYASVISFGMCNQPGLFFLIQRSYFYWLTYFVLGFSIMLISLAVTGVFVFAVGAEAAKVAPSITLIILTTTVLAGLFLWRVWPALMTPFLLEGRNHNSVPWEHFAFNRFQSSWIGPGLPHAWRCTRDPYVRRFISPLGLVAATALLSSVYISQLASLYPNIKFFVIAVISYAVLPLTFLVLAATAWAALVLSRQSPLSVQPAHLKIDLACLTRAIAPMVKQRMYVSRLPDCAVTFLTLCFASDSMDFEALREDIYTLGSVQKGGAGIGYYQIWDDLASQRNDMLPCLFIDIQGVILVAALGDKSSKAYRSFMRTVEIWKTRYPIESYFEE